MNSANAVALQPPFQPDIKIGRINADEDVRLELGKALRQVAADFHQARQTAEDFHDAHHRQLFHLIPGFAAFGLHAWASHADETGIGMTRFERANQTGAKNIAGSFSGDQGYREGTH